MTETWPDWPAWCRLYDGEDDPISSVHVWGTHVPEYGWVEVASHPQSTWPPYTQNTWIYFCLDCPPIHHVDYQAVYHHRDVEEIKMHIQRYLTEMML